VVNVAHLSYSAQAGSVGVGGGVGGGGG